MNAEVDGSSWGGKTCKEAEWIEVLEEHKENLLGGTERLAGEDKEGGSWVIKLMLEVDGSFWGLKNGIEAKWFEVLGVQREVITWNRKHCRRGQRRRKLGDEMNIEVDGSCFRSEKWYKGRMNWSFRGTKRSYYRRHCRRGQRRSCVTECIGKLMEFV